MPYTNGHDPKRAILYARVSSDEQAKKGYSIGGQIDEIREHAEERGWEIVTVETDPGYSRETLWRPGLDRVRGLVTGGGVDIVLAWKRDRFGASPVPQLLTDEFAEHGTTLRSLDDSGEGEDAEFIHGIKDLIARRELRDIARRSRMGRLAKARKGEVVASHKAAYGFRFNEGKTGYEVDHEQMAVVRGIFRMLAAEGKTLYAVRSGLVASGIPTPSGKKYWSQTYLRSIVENDIYKPHSYEEAGALVSSQVASRLDPEKRYGILWWGKRKQTKRQAANAGANGKPYGYTYKNTARPREEWVAIPVPDPGIPPDWVDTAREAIKQNRRPSSCGHRFWELSGGILRCGGCNCLMQTTGIRSHGKNLHFYYRCSRRVRDGKDACPNKKNVRADDVEPRVWELVSGLLKDPERLRMGLERMIEEERKRLRCNPEEEAALWAKRIDECTSQRERRLQQHAEGLVGLDELREKLGEIEETRNVAERELKRLRNLAAQIAALEQDKEALLESYASMIPEDLDALSSEERHQVYKMLRLEVIAQLDGTYKASGVLLGQILRQDVSSSEISCGCAETLWGPRRS